MIERGGVRELLTSSGTAEWNQAHLPTERSANLRKCKRSSPFQSLNPSAVCEVGSVVRGNGGHKGSSLGSSLHRGGAPEASRRDQLRDAAAGARSGATAPDRAGTENTGGAEGQVTPTFIFSFHCSDTPEARKKRGGFSS